MEPEDAIGDGPFIYIALPAGTTRVGRASGVLVDLIPINATKLLREWEVLLDPIAAMRAPQLLREVPRWVIDEVFVEPTGRTSYLVGEAAKTDDVTRRLLTAAAASTHQEKKTAGQSATSSAAAA